MAQNQQAQSSSSGGVTDLLAYGILITAGLIIAGVPLVLGIACWMAGRLLGIRWWGWLLAAAAIGGSSYLLIQDRFFMDYSGAIKAAWAAREAFKEALEAQWWPWLKMMLPFSLTVAFAMAGGLETYTEFARPWWKPRREQKPFGLIGWLQQRQRWARIEAGHGQSKDGFTIGLNQSGRPVAISDREANMHGLIVGGTGTGKTTSAFQILAGVVPRGLPVIMIDLKGDPEVAFRLQALAERNGRVFELWSLNGPGHWNPLGRGDATELKDKLIGLEEWTEPHYKRAAERYLQRVLSTLELLGEQPALHRVVELLYPPAFEELARSRAPPELEANQLRSYLQGLDKTQLSAVSGMQSRLGLLVESRSGRYFQENGALTIDLYRTVREGRVTLFSLDSQRYGSSAAQIGSMVLQDLKTVAAELLTAGQKRPAYVIIDEFSALAGDQVLGLLNKGRSAGLCVWLSTQELADLSRINPFFVDQVIGNTNIKIVHRQDNPESAERMAAVVGTRSAWEETYQMRFGGQGLSGDTTGLGSLRKTEQFVIHPNIIKGLRVGQCVVIRKSPKMIAEVVQVVPSRVR